MKVSLPFGDLLLAEGDGPLPPASAGIGVTPMPAVPDHLATASPERPVTVVHADRSPAHHAHHAHRLELAELVELVERLPDVSLHLWYEDTANHPDVSAEHVSEVIEASPAGEPSEGLERGDRADDLAVDGAAGQWWSARTPPLAGVRQGTWKRGGVPGSLSFRFSPESG